MGAPVVQVCTWLFSVQNQKPLKAEGKEKSTSTTEADDHMPDDTSGFELVVFRNEELPCVVLGLRIGSQVA